MKVHKAPQEIKVGRLPEGWSQRAFDVHFNVLYKGYVKKYNELQDLLEQADLGSANPTYSQFREVKREEAFTANAIRLHERFFSGLGGDGRCTGVIDQWIREDFGSYDNWSNEWTACGLSARGWVVLAYDMSDRRLHNYILDIHSDGFVEAAALLVMDVYEHSYYLDFATDRKSYIMSYLNNINWSYANSLIDRLELAKVRPAA